jgi:hypothetical protein
MDTRATVAGVLCLWLAAPAIAADLQYQVVTSDSPREIGRRVDRLAEEGYRVLAIVADAPSTTLVLSRDNKGLRKNVAIAEYRVIDGKDATLVRAAGAEGYQLRATGRGQLARPVAVFERLLGTPVTPHDYRAEQVAPGNDVEPVLAAAGGEGYRTIAAVGDAGSEWIILERLAGAPNGTPRDVRVVSGTAVSSVEQAINALAKEGFDVDAAWNRAPKGFGLFRAPTLMATLSRRRGTTAATAPVAINFGREPDTVGQFVAVVPFRGRFAFVVRIDERSDYATREIEWTNAAPKNAWEESPFLVTLRREWWKPIEAAWAISSANRVTHWIALERP